MTKGGYEIQRNLGSLIVAWMRGNLPPVDTGDIAAFINLKFLNVILEFALFPITALNLKREPPKMDI